MWKLEELRIKLQELILANGTLDEEVLEVSHQLDEYIVKYYVDNSDYKKVNFENRQAVV